MPQSPAPTDDVTTPPPTDLVPFTCPWAQDGLAKALEGLGAITGSGVTQYHIGSRGLKRLTLEEQSKAVDYWNQMVKLYCGAEVLPDSLTGRDTAFRVVPRDI